MLILYLKIRTNVILLFGSGQRIEEREKITRTAVSSVQKNFIGVLRLVPHMHFLKGVEGPKKERIKSNLIYFVIIIFKAVGTKRGHTCDFLECSLAVHTSSFSRRRMKRWMEKNKCHNYSI